MKEARLFFQVQLYAILDILPAIDVYEWMIQLYPDWFEVYNGIADVYRFKGDNQMAIKYYAKSLEMNPDFGYAKEIAATIEELSKN